MTPEEIAKVLDEHRKWREDCTTGKRADLGGAYLGGADLRSANLRGADLRSADLGGANLGDANLRGADLRSADLGGADLRDADHCIRLDMVDPREYQPVAVATDAGWLIYSGCRSFTVDEALYHWGESYREEREIGDRYLRAIKALPECPEAGS